MWNAKDANERKFHLRLFIVYENKYLRNLRSFLFDTSTLFGE